MKMVIKINAESKNMSWSKSRFNAWTVFEANSLSWTLSWAKVWSRSKFWSTSWSLSNIWVNAWK